MQSIENKVINRIYGNGRGWAFFKNDFVDLGSANAVDLALHRLLKKGKIRRVLRGVYDYPKYSKLLGQNLSPDVDQVAQALARKFGWKIQISGSAALNVLGLSTQVPTRYLYYSDGTSKVYQIGNVQLEFKKTALKDTGMKYPESVLIVQAIKALGKKTLTKEQRQIILDYFSSEQHGRILKDTKYTTSWVYESIKRVFKDH
ncbi:MAG: DUF6088 family protein [Thermodesulfobacteriota bacterium]|jgi:hypothetical protein